MYRKLIVFSVLILLTLASISAQSKSKIWGGVEIGYGVTLSDENISQSETFARIVCFYKFSFLQLFLLKFSF